MTNRPGQIVTLRLNEEKNVGTLKIKYANYGHENAASNPNDSFAATVGFYVFKLTDGPNKQEITFYLGTTQTTEPSESWSKYWFKLKNISSGNEIATLEITQKGE